MSGCPKGSARGFAGDLGSLGGRATTGEQGLYIQRDEIHLRDAEGARGGVGKGNRLGGLLNSCNACGEIGARVAVKADIRHARLTERIGESDGEGEVARRRLR